jgi:hypothetical protein
MVLHARWPGSFVWARYLALLAAAALTTAARESKLSRNSFITESVCTASAVAALVRSDTQDSHSSCAPP